MEQLEEGDDREIDLDSTLAPLSQPSQKSINSQLKKLSQSQENGLEEKCNDRSSDHEDLFDEFDEDLINEFNETMDFVERGNEPIPQLDGEHEVQKQSPTRFMKKRNSFTRESPKGSPKESPKDSPKKSPKSPKKNHFQPLDIIISSSGESFLFYFFL